MVTRLEIVNHMLFTVGEAVHVTLDTQHPSILQAEAILDSVDGDFQGRGWWFNVENGLVLAQDDQGHVIIPENSLSVEVVTCPYWNLYTPGIPNNYNRARYAVRGQKLYDTMLHTYEINAPLTVNVVIRQPIPDLPHNAATYLKHKAAEAMYTADDGDKLKMDRLEVRTVEAWHLLKAEELKVANLNALNSPAAAQLRYRGVQYSGSTNPLYPGGGR